MREIWVVKLGEIRQTGSSGGDPVNGDKKRCFEAGYGQSPTETTNSWMTIEIVNVMNDRDKTNGTAYMTFNGKSFGRVNNVMWAKNPEASAALFMEWRNMNGRTATDSVNLPIYDLKQWFKDFELLIIDR